MIEQLFLPRTGRSCVVQVNYKSGDICFYTAKDAKEAVSLFKGNIVAIFKPKLFTRSVINDTAQANQ